MRIAMKAEVESRLLLVQLEIVEFENTRVEFVPGPDGILSSIAVSRAVPDYNPRMSAVEPSPSGVPTIRFQAPSFVDDLVQLLQYIESLGAFWLNIRKIRWEEPLLEWRPESPAEEASITVRSYRFSYQFPDPTDPFRRDHVEELFRDPQSKLDLILPLAFFREGLNAHRQARFATAFINFYFFLEGRYAGGLTNNRRVERAFLEAKELVSAAESVVSTFSNPAIRERHSESILRWLQMCHREMNSEGLLGLLVWMRGNLLHFNPRSSTPKSHPMNEREYEALSYVALAICMHLVPLLLSHADPS